MDAVTLDQVQDRLRQLSPEKLIIVYNFAGSLLARAPTDADARSAALATEAVLRREWDLPEEDEAWADL
jgi:hypothetical protein